ncbi:uncharacterized protein BDW43DRAFT_279026 [Aspergillus alliaceus]|uniref:uncharacterized protein n=1 Tax=Petromyces alliaceus TaxID=209559 RepID=UPI0012A6E94D|nr:uncharacterized protein BDW43DRAFT_279026 [Aspergillus alliaceus]KAB8232600.1 hypothetical protein BDW43DRAFT_279026 [Aspergillus alliaceus]
MAEIIIKNNYPLNYAVISLLTKEALQDATNLSLTTTKLGGMDRYFATGIMGEGTRPIDVPAGSDKDGNPTSRVKITGNFAWTVRWDWDPKKGEHVNATFTQKNPKTTHKYAIETKGIPGGSEQYQVTIDRFTHVTGYNRKEYDAADEKTKKKLMKEWSDNGRKAWLFMS